MFLNLLYRFVLITLIFIFALLQKSDFVLKREVFESVLQT